MASEHDSHQFLTLLLVQTLSSHATAIFKQAVAILADFIWNAVVVSQSVSNDDSFYPAVLRWTSTCKGLSKRHQIVGLDEAPWLSHLRMGDIEGPADKPLFFTPSPGRCYFFLRSKFFWVNRQITRTMPGGRRETITIKSFGRDPTAIKELLRSIKADYFEQKPGKVASYEASGDQEPKWELVTSQSRDMSTIAMDQEQKLAVVKDLKDFLEPSQFKYYSERSIPFRRGYLFHGPPGTGKTSFCLALATEFQLDIYIISVGTVDDKSLGKLFRQLPMRCIVLLEDIETPQSTHKRPQPPERRQELQQTQQVTDLTRSGLLNILDGAGARQGRVLIMSTNHRSELDPAITRPGRVDMEVAFALANQETARQLFRSLILTGSSITEESANTKTADMSRDFAAEFAQNISEGVVSQAELQGYLVRRRRDPQAAVDEVSAWFKEKSGLVID
ncbi:hypothetical protein CFIO01_02317 [Colletotrichum fioriniae PJ7]|uniref:Mitochondrial chaperone bcs1 n=1 Tax=Colletotrichum fioriniae PJ7 TaxID=1445577 RepID=A0A010SMV5_9PEZI|nr:hypothetical protein CFIO01_02317 [Colletotrichum fioriniae PJ7]